MYVRTVDSLLWFDIPHNADLTPASRMLIAPLVLNLIAVLFVCWFITACTSDTGLMYPFRNVQVDKRKEPNAHDGTKHLERMLIIVPFLIGLWCVYELAINGPSHIGAGGWTAVFALVLIFVTAHQVLYANRQWNAMGQQLRQMHLEQRAWLSITAKIVRLEVGWPLEVDFIISNSGRTPAMIHKTRLGASIQPDYRVVDYDQFMVNHAERPWDDRQNTVAPGGDYVVPLTRGRVMTREHIISLAPDNYGVLYFAMTIKYSDFADGRESQVLLTYSLELDRFQQWIRHNYMK